MPVGKYPDKRTVDAEIYKQYDVKRIQKLMILEIDSQIIGVPKES
jgi:hypothetical protein